MYLFCIEASLHETKIVSYYLVQHENTNQQCLKEPKFSFCEESRSFSSNDLVLMCEGRIWSLELQFVVGLVLRSLFLVVAIVQMWNRDRPGDVHVPCTRRNSERDCVTDIAVLDGRSIRPEDK